ncbi:Panacea domain-containing protein [Flavobacterium sp. NRK1]|uniref:Panacea domain-containing protein n=1 Tax=Flavobacterium sp. NRK1 TaxID=2954929 RepID=UPI00209249BA|nr:Panacea domain-containing protein [Flavobacterium sp. NRK1]MCO6147525.1 Panacea domain-containing protein [Flavobacterium sp. NRK1]
MYSKEDIEKLANTIIFLAERIEDLSKTKLLKILYILDEFSIKQTGIPFLNLKYEVWQYGPVAQDIFIDLSDDPVILKDFISLERYENKTYIKPKKGFNDDEFSSNEITFLERITEALKKHPAYVLVDFTHKKDSLWYNTALKHNLLEAFNEGFTNSSNIQLDFTELVKDEPTKLSKYLHHMSLENSLKQFKT